MHHYLHICKDIAEKIQNPLNVKETITHSITRGKFHNNLWNETAFFEGYPGIACFYAVMDKIDPQETWRKLSHTYLNEAIRKAEVNGFNDTSLFSGIAGLCFSVYLCSNQGKYYQSLQETLDKLLVEYVEAEIKRLNTSETTSFHSCNLMSGVTGILAYALLRKNDSVFLQLATSITKWLVNFFNKEGSNAQPAWHIAPKDLLADEERIKYPEGAFFMNTPIGIVGCLSALALAIKEEVHVEHLQETALKLALWIKNQACTSEYGTLFPNTLDARTSSCPSLFEINYDTWWSGIPCVARALYLTGKALKDFSLTDYAEKLFVSLFSKPIKEWNMMGTSFSNGRAGVLAITCRMAEETQNPFLWKQVKNLEDDLKSFYRPHSPFGFQSVYVDNHTNYHWIDDPGLFTGAVGIALSLLLTEHKDTLWDRAFLLV
ncbi:MAG: lanthionine synthetase C family protein [Chlamydiales bacterium]|nr:lanthionine synthetase C family protein [Chlamydiales bacterium]